MLASTDSRRSPTWKASAARVRSSSGFAHHRPACSTIPGSGQASVPGPRVRVDRHQLGVGFGGGRCEPCITLERRLQRAGHAKACAGGRRLDRIAIVERPIRGFEELCRLLELPGAQRLADDRWQLPLPCPRDDVVVLASRSGPLAEQGRLLRANDPGTPQVVVRPAGLILEQVEQAAPVRRSGARVCHPFGAVARPVHSAATRRAHARWSDLRLVSADAAPGRFPRARQPVQTGPLGDQPCELRRRRVAVVLLGSLVRPDRAPTH